MLQTTSLELFSDVGDPDVRRIASLCTERRYPAGSTIFSEGDPGDAMFIVMGGLVELVSASNKGAETILHLLKPNQIFGELLFSEERRAFERGRFDGRRRFRHSAEEPRADLGQLSGGRPEFHPASLGAAHPVEQGLAGFGHTLSYERLGKALLDLGREHGVKTPKGTLIPLRLTHDDLAKLIGTTRETVTTQINRFRRLRLVRREGRHFVVDTDLLTRFLDLGDDPVGPGRESILVNLMERKGIRALLGP